MTTTTWVDQAACRDYDTEQWFPNKGTRPVLALDVCNNLCPVRQQCLDYAVTNKIREGVWGGRTDRQRRGDRSDAA